MALPDGVHLNLPDEPYFAEGRLGSSDMIRLARFREGWWWRSPHNPDRPPDKVNEALNYGHALHAIMLEGMEAYEARFAVAPAKSDYADLMVTIDHMKAALAEAGVDTTGSSKWKRENWAAACAAEIPTVPCWDNIMAEFATANAGRESVTSTEDRMLRIMRDTAMDDAEIADLLAPADVPGLAEVSYLWTDEVGLKRRARFDRLTPSLIVDLKSLGNWQGRDLDYAIGDHVLRERYDVQMADYHGARRHMLATIAQKGEGAIHGGTTEQRAFLLAMARRNPAWEWCWLFYQKPDPAGRAPILYPLWEKWGGLYHRNGYRGLIKARTFYLAQVERVGLFAPWVRVERLRSTSEVPGHPDIKHITQPNWGWDTEPVDGEIEAIDSILQGAAA